MYSVVNKTTGLSAIEDIPNIRLALCRKADTRAGQRLAGRDRPIVR
jgi:hypothetical protein